MRVSIIITNYNKGSYLEEAIESALSQTYEDFEILIIDDGSTDNSHLILQKYEGHSQIRIILQENQRVIKTRNRAIEEANGDLIVQLDGDDVLFGDFVKVAAQEFLTDSGSKIIYGNTFFIGAKQGKWELGTYSLNKQLLTNQIVVSAMFMKQDFLEVGGYSEAFADGYEDWDFWLNLIQYGSKVVQLDVPMLKYRILETARNNSISSTVLKNIRATVVEKYPTLYKKHFPNILELAWELERFKELEQSRQLLLQSKEYKLGSFILKPFRWIQRKMRN